MSEPLSIGAIVLSAVTAAFHAAPRVSRWWAERGKANASVEVARAKVAEREASQRIETERARVEEIGVAERMIADRADELREREAEHAAERAAHLACLRQVGELRGDVGRLEGEVLAERTARQSLERVVVWLLERVGLDHDSPPADVAQTLDRIRPTLAPEPAE